MKHGVPAAMPVRCTRLTKGTAPAAAIIISNPNITPLFLDHLSTEHSVAMELPLGSVVQSLNREYYV